MLCRQNASVGIQYFSRLDELGGLCGEYVCHRNGGLVLIEKMNGMGSIEGGQ
jgi:hypothetical protein